jgi:hypothetical protein
MPFELTNSYNKVSQYICQSDFIYNTLKNPVSISLILTVLLMIIIIALVGEDLDYDRREYVRIGVHIFLMSSIVISLHHYAYSKMINDSQKEGGLSKVYNAIGGFQSNPNLDAYPVLPRFDNSIKDIDRSSIRVEKRISGGESNTEDDIGEYYDDDNVSVSSNTSDDNVDNIKLENVELDL